MNQLIRPAALLLDFGGVVVATTNRPSWPEELAAELHHDLMAAGCHELTPDDIVCDLEAAAAADSHWKNAMSRPAAPVEMTAHRYWTEFVAADWPPAARAFVTAHAQVLCHRQGQLRQDRETRPGIGELLDTARHHGLPVAVVSNALSGSVHRAYLRDAGLDKRLALQVYSDEVGVRKPNPEMIHLAARALDVPAGLTWYVGDNFDRDVLCGRRAGVGASVLMEARGTYRRPYVVRVRPDAVVADPYGLRDLLVAAFAQPGTGGDDAA
ncbi:HAD family hydrolase [Streptomyces lancefieldiae]|uniref:HAD-IA family hydrolase n=1 Tax=Streptomyces lancefieldiae TaxID=3075520 RepID=A0ABU3AGS9_9ACTN|nr:HAD-IA family hydrolase [Streptomyces sp. DSM 40712]MDT0609105.1 HAD-IA family hydrolase [Streptomyces sp. DSM 40712]